MKKFSLNKTIAIVILSYVFVLWDATVILKTPNKRIEIKYQGLIWYSLYKLADIPEHAYFITYKTSTSKS